MNAAAVTSSGQTSPGSQRRYPSRRVHKPGLPCAHLLIGTEPSVKFNDAELPQLKNERSAFLGKMIDGSFVDPAASHGPRYASQRSIQVPRPSSFSEDLAALLSRFHESGWLPRSFSGDPLAAAAMALASSSTTTTHREAAAHLFSVKVTLVLMEGLRLQLNRRSLLSEGGELDEASMLELEATMGSVIQQACTPG